MQAINSTRASNIYSEVNDDIVRAYKMINCKKCMIKNLHDNKMPYPGGQADGLSFSSGNNKLPYSLEIIFEELAAEGFGKRTKVTLEDWAEQGVLLLNTHLTTVSGQTNAHAHIGWDNFTGKVLDHTITMNNIVYMLWGKPAQLMFKRRRYKTFQDRLLLEAYHPAAERYGYKFVGCDHFMRANNYLIARNKEPINWNPST